MLMAEAVFPSLQNRGELTGKRLNVDGHHNSGITTNASVRFDRAKFVMSTFLFVLICRLRSTA